MIKNVIFDIGNVLADFRYRDYMKELGFSEEIMEVFCKEVVETPLWNELDRGVRSFKDVTREMKSCVAEYPKEADAFFENIHEIVHTFPYALPWIEELKAKGYKVYLLSNYSAELFTLHAKDRFDFAEAVDGKIISGFVKLIKPDPAIYRLLLNTYRLNPEECVFLDDRKENVEAAKGLGIYGIQFTSYEQAREELNRRRGKNED